jgi:UDP-N-acetylglucosamine acyltransferase
MVFGTPGAPRGINSEGLKRRDFSTEQIRNIKEAYRIVYRRGLKLDEAIVQLEQRSADQPELAILLESLRSTERGIIR